MIINGISGGVMTQHSHLQLGNGKVIDVKFLNNESLLVLLAITGQSFLGFLSSNVVLNRPYRGGSSHHQSSPRVD